MLPARDARRRQALVGLMAGFFKVDIDDFNEVWSHKKHHGLFIVYAALMERAWRQDKPKHVQEGQYRFTLWKNQLILNVRSIALQTDIAESTLRDDLKKLEMLEVILIGEPVPRIKVVTIFRAYDYGANGERTPCLFRAPTVVDLRTDRNHTAQDPPHQPCNDFINNNLQHPYTEDSRLEDSENQNRLVRSKGTRDGYLHDAIPELAGMLKEKTPSLTDEQAIMEAESLLLEADDS